VVEEIKAIKKAIDGLTEDAQVFEIHEINLQTGDDFLFLLGVSYKF
jgi:hypothetical protein